jgi:hypothetical protein
MIAMIFQGALAMLAGLSFGYFAYWKQIGVWGNIGVFGMGMAFFYVYPDSPEWMAFVLVGGVLVGAVYAMVLGHVTDTIRIFEREFESQYSAREGWQNTHTGFGFEDTDEFFWSHGSQGAHSFHGQSGAYRPVLRPAKDYYAILGVARTANDAEIKSAYRQRIMSCHPDRFPEDKQKEALAKEINEAYDVLSDPQKRAAFDHFGIV